MYSGSYESSGDSSEWKFPQLEVKQGRREDVKRGERVKSHRRIVGRLRHPVAPAVRR